MSKKKKSNFGLWIGVLIAIFIVIFVIIKITSPESAVVNTELTKIREDDWIKGNENGNLEIVEYSDFQCPACKVYKLIIDQLFRDFGDQVKLTYRHFPLRNSHPNSFLAARAAEAAGMQGKFWEMHDLLFERQSEWAELPDLREKLIEYAGLLGLDIEKFKNDLDSDLVATKIENHEQEALNAKFRGTPTIFINGHEIKNIRTYEDLRSLVMEYGGTLVENKSEYQIKSATSS